MRIYLDDDSIAAALVGMLRKAGHDVRVPAEIGLRGADDVIHLTRAICEERVLVSGDHDDFQALHLLVVAAKGHHPGILIVRRDNDAARDMSARGVFNAISKLVASAISIEDEFVVLNHWR